MARLTTSRNWRWLVLATALFAAPAFATGTVAGTVIDNTATLDYSVAGVPAAPVTSAPATLVVDELIELTLTWQDGSAVAVSTPDVDDALTFLLTNTGNGDEAFGLTRNNAVAGDNYDPTNGTSGAIFLESGLAPGFQASGANADTLYVPGSNDPNLAPDAAQIIYVVSNTPSALANGNTGSVRLDVASLTPGAAGSPPGTSLSAASSPALAGGKRIAVAVVGAGNAQARAVGTYVVGGLSVIVTKTVLSIVDTHGGNSLEPGATITYRVLMTLSGAGTADNLVITDPLPAEVTYVTNSILVNGAARTDAADADNAQFSANTVSVSLGSTPAPATVTVDFRATLN